MDWLFFFIGCCIGSLSGIIFCSWLEKRSERDIDRASWKGNEESLDDDPVIISLIRCKKCGEVIVKEDNPFYQTTCSCFSVAKN